MRIGFIMKRNSHSICEKHFFRTNTRTKDFGRSVGEKVPMQCGDRPQTNEKVPMQHGNRPRTNEKVPTQRGDRPQTNEKVPTQRGDRPQTKLSFLPSAATFAADKQIIHIGRLRKSMPPKGVPYLHRLRSYPKNLIRVMPAEGQKVVFISFLCTVNRSPFN